VADRSPRERGPSAWHELPSDSPRAGYGSSEFRGALLVVLLHLMDHLSEGHRLSALSSRTVRPCLMDRPPGLSQDS
jgi:hypothetical protein